MKLPNHTNAIIDLAKIRDYVLNPDHPRGKHKAKVFARVLGFDDRDAKELKRQILVRIGGSECLPGIADDYGQRFHADVPVAGRFGEVIVRTGWIVLKGESAPRLTTCFVRS
ncbi:MAG TPA: hypothetical protein PLA50_10215 [Bacteroidia bacterium]|nr:hypothetical protein [Bacteroidia bacterium]